MRAFLRRVRYQLQRRRLSRELQSDMEFHREMAAAAGRSNFGNLLRLQEQSREAWGWMWIDRLMQDLRYAARILRRSLVFTCTAVLVLAIGIGVNVTAFSLFNLVALKPLPVHDPQSLVRVERRSPEITTSEVPYPFIAFYGEHARTLSAVMAVMGAPGIRLDHDIQPVTVNYVTPNYFRELGTRAEAGSLRLADAQGTAPGVIISYGLWQRRFGGDRSLVGRAIRLNQKPVTVSGVLPEAFASLDGQQSDVWLSLLQQPYFVEGSSVLTNPDADGARMWARLAPGASRQSAAAEMLALVSRLRQQYPKQVWKDEYILVEPGGHGTVMRPEMYQVGAIVGALVLLILLIACSNLGGLMMARGVTREHEIGIRIAIGASRQRIFRQLATESLLLALAGAFAGLVLSTIVMRITLVAMDAPGWMSAIPDWRVLAFTVSATVLAAALFGMGPVLQLARQRHRRAVLRQWFVGLQIAGSTVLLIVAALLVRGALHLLYSDPGFGYEQVFSIAPGLDNHGYTPYASRNYLAALKQRLFALPGVQSVALSGMPLLGHGVTSYMSVTIAGQPVNVYPNWVDADFFRTMSIPLLRGRNLLPNEKNAVVVSESFARRQWPGEDPLGKRMWRDGDSPDIIVGVVGNARIKALNDGDAAEVYWPLQEDKLAGMTVLVKTAGAPEGLLQQSRVIAESLDPKLFPYIWMLKEGFRKDATNAKSVAAIVSLLGVVAVAMAAIGIVGLIAYAVTQRMKEIAIRLALGAQPVHVFAAILYQFCWPLAFGLVAGLGTAAGFSKALRKVLYGVSNLDPISYGASLALLTLLVFTATLIPVGRALRVDLARTLHRD